MSALIPALIQFAMSRMRRGGGGGGYGGGYRGGYGGGYRGGYRGGRSYSPRPEPSAEESSDKYWSKQILSGAVGRDDKDDVADDREYSAYLKELAGIGAETNYDDMLNFAKQNPFNK